MWEIRTPRVVLGLIVGALLAGSGAGYQGVFRNPLADPYLLGIAAGAGLGATLAIVGGLGDGLGILDPIPVAAFVGALIAVSAAALLSVRRRASTSPSILILAGVSVAASIPCKRAVASIEVFLFRTHALQHAQVEIAERLLATRIEVLTMFPTTTREDKRQVGVVVAAAAPETGAKQDLCRFKHRAALVIPGGLQSFDKTRKVFHQEFFDDREL